MTIDPDTFRAVLGHFASGITVVTMRDEQGRDQGMTVSAFCSLSLEPPLILICVAHDASMHGLLRVGAPFVVNVLSSAQEPISRRFSGPDTNRFGGLGYTTSPGGAAVLDDILAHLECTVDALHPGGDHTICVGRVETAVVRRGHPLLYYRGGYTQLER